MKLPIAYKEDSFFLNKAHRGKAARYLRNSSKPPTLLHQGYAGFSSPSSPQQAAGYSAKENKSFLFPSRNQGFSLIEVIITLAIISFIFSGGVFISIDSLRSYNFFSEEKTLVSLLRTARSRAMNNIGAVPHGVFISESEFILFRGSDFDENSQENESFKRNRSILIEHDLKNNPIIIFENLTGKLDLPIQLKIFDGLRESIIKVESEGRIES